MTSLKMADGISRNPVALRVLTHWGRHKIPAIFQTIFSNAFSSIEMLEFSIKISLKFVSKFAIDNNPESVQLMARRRSGGSPLSEPMIV